MWWTFNIPTDHAGIRLTNAVTCTFARWSDALACYEALVLSDWIRANTRRW